MADYQYLKNTIEKHCGATDMVVVAMSGGVDSGLVAAAAHAVVGDRCIGVTIHSELTLCHDVEVAASVSKKKDIPHRTLDVSVLGDTAVRANGEDRCYHCKKLLFSRIVREFSGCRLLDGTNADDDPARPGRQAAEELGVFSPLLAAGIGKARVRDLAREIGLPNWGAPSESCLAARIRHGIPLSKEGLDKVRVMEGFFHEAGVPTLRVYHDNLVATVVYLQQYAEIMENQRDNFAALVEKIGLLSFDFKEYTE